ncbi:MAG TPA: hypothetical protein PLD54_01715 [Candidatus Levybacteria bacterium]|nr:hypothetical protein [Candidatus Levybacteria bacterium]
MIDFKTWLTNIPRQYRTHQNADLSLEEYLNIYKEEFKKVRIGCSFAPDLVEQMYRLENGKQTITVEQKVKLLKVLIHDLGMRDIRLGVKWNKVINSKGKFDFSYYHPYLDYCLSHNVAVCLNVGPIKTFGWPEEYIPDSILEKVKHSGIVVDTTTKLAKHAFEYLEMLLKHIKTTYTKEQLQYVKIIQPENEAFNVFGKHRVVLQNDYLYEIIKKIVAVFPNKKILLTSAETRDTRKIHHLIERCVTDGIKGKNFIVGINYYNLPSFLKVPKLGPVDDITVSNFLQSRTHTMNIHTSRRMGFKIEVTEAQFEQWGRAYLSPGNSHHEAKYLFDRIVENTLDPQTDGLIRLWGFERYAKKKLEQTLTQDHQMNLKLIHAINSKNFLC